MSDEPRFCRDCKWSRSAVNDFMLKCFNPSVNAGDAWVYGNAQVSGNAWVYGNARVFGDAWVSGDARVHGNALVSGNARVFGDAWVSGDAHLLQAGPLGSRNAFITAFRCEVGFKVATGCFLGSPEEFMAAVIETHGDNDHARLYRAFIEMATYKFRDYMAR